MMPRHRTPRPPCCVGSSVEHMLGNPGGAAATRGEVDAPDDLVAFLQAQNCTNFVGSWRHPEASPDFMTADYYRHIARVLEAGKFHVGFFDDRLAMPDRFGGDHAHTVANGIRCVKMDPITILTVMGMATERLGSWLDLLHHLLRAVPRRARVPDTGPDDQRPRRLEHRDLDERRRGAEHGPRRARRA